MFKPGKNHDGFFDSKELIAQVDHAIDIFEGKTNHLAQGLFMFDNAPSHLKCAKATISAKKMVKVHSLPLFIYLFIFLLLIDVPPRFQVSVDASTERAMHVRWLQPPDR